MWIQFSSEGKLQFLVLGSIYIIQIYHIYIRLYLYHINPQHKVFFFLLHSSCVGSSMGALTSETRVFYSILHRRWIQLSKLRTMEEVTSMLYQHCQFKCFTKSYNWEQNWHWHRIMIKSHNICCLYLLFLNNCSWFQVEVCRLY